MVKTSPGMAIAVAVTLACASWITTAPASAATMVTRTGSCSTSEGTVRVAFSTADNATRYGTFRYAQASASGVGFSDEPAMTVRIRDGYGKLVVVKRSTDGSLALAFWKKIAGPNWTAEATIENTLDGPCTTPRVKIAA